VGWPFSERLFQVGDVLEEAEADLVAEALLGLGCDKSNVERKGVGCKGKGGVGEVTQVDRQRCAIPSGRYGCHATPPLDRGLEEILRGNHREERGGCSISVATGGIRTSGSVVLGHNGTGPEPKDR
jgi:hypothetical protein